MYSYLTLLLYLLTFNKIRELQNFIILFHYFLGAKQSNNKHKKSSSAGKWKKFENFSLMAIDRFACAGPRAWKFLDDEQIKEVFRATLYVFFIMVENEIENLIGFIIVLISND